MANQEIADDLRAALEQVEDILGDLNERAAGNGTLEGNAIQEEST